MANADSPSDADTPRVLLFGHTGAGKSALIGALLRAGETQGETLCGEVVCPTGALPRIRDAVYSGQKIAPLQQELASHIIRLRPWRVGTKPVGPALTVRLDDCDGRAAEALLEDPAALAAANCGPVARAAVEADAILLLVDATSTADEFGEAFAQFDRFLKAVVRTKADARAVGGLPVYLVLTKCDALARSGDTLGAWEARKKERAEAAWKAFDAFLRDASEDDDPNGAYFAFGSVQLDVIAVAVRNPPLPGAGAHDSPHRVAELFRDCFREAAAHNDRAHSSAKRLKWTVRAALAAVGALFVALALVALFPPVATGPALAERVLAYQLHEPPAATRLADDKFAHTKRALQQFATDSGFVALAPDLRAFVESRVKETDEYEKFRGALANTAAPASARTVPELHATRAALLGPLALPAQYAWGETPAGLLRDKWLRDCAAIEAAQHEMVKAYRGHDKDGTSLLLARALDAGWLDAFEKLRAKADAPPFPLSAPVPGSPELPRARGEPVPYRVPYEFDEVYRARRYWEQTRDRLAHVRDLSDALGATASANRPDAVLVLPEPGTEDSETLPGKRWAALRKVYPRQSDDYPEWELWQFADPLRGDLAARAQRSFDIGVRHLRTLLKIDDTREGWKALAASLDRPAVREWGRLLHLLARISDRDAPDPVSELAEFLHTFDARDYELDMRGFDLVVPLDLTSGIDRIDPVGPLSVIHSRAQMPVQTVAFAVGKGSVRDGATVYPLSGKGKIAYRPFDDLRAELPAKAGGRALTFVWTAPTLAAFRFERLSRAPVLAKPTGAPDPAPGARLVPREPTAIPKLPVLLK
jgi:energy-coupling factor transporter ATP-binding protein EcfA2